MIFGVVVVACNGERHLEACLQSVLDQTHTPRRLIVVDNNSADGSLAIARSLEPKARQRNVAMTVIELQEDIGHTSGTNRGLEVLLETEEENTSAAVLLDQEAALEQDWCGAVTAAFATDSRIGAVGSKVMSPNRLTVQHAGGFLDRPRLLGRHYGHHITEEPNDFSTAREVEYVTVAAMAIRLTTLKEVGILDEWYSPRYYEDIDWCTRARKAGWSVKYEPRAVVTQWGDPLLSRLPPDRLNAFHRNRLIYAMPSLSTESSRRDFAAAERRHFRGDIPLEDRRAIAVAYLWLLLVLPDLEASGRIPRDPGRPGSVTELIEFFASLRREVTLV